MSRCKRLDIYPETLSLGAQHVRIGGVTAKTATKCPAISAISMSIPRKKREDRSGHSIAGGELKFKCLIVHRRSERELSVLLPFPSFLSPIWVSCDEQASSIVPLYEIP